jgi:hypothetical protein
MSHTTRRLALAALAATAALALSACSGPYTVTADVSSYGSWPADRKTGSYAFERLPSQQQSEEAGKRQAALEDAAKAALAKAGLTPATDAATADVVVTLGARVSAYDPVPWDDPLWWRWRGRLVSPRYGYGGWGWRHDPVFDRRYDRAVAVLVRDRASGTALFEAHASNEGATIGSETLLGALFEAAMTGFPATTPQSHCVSVQVAH